jgi:hypothetical protein
MAWGYFVFSVGVMFTLWHISGYVSGIYLFDLPLGLGALISFIGLLVVLVGMVLSDDEK